ncbi:MAG: hypothetical protein VX211_02685, partial [Pseudomonadota bacterium]|nr:hypothetical protein [Pseudomonadota bacterium]
HPMSTIDEQNVRHVHLRGMEVDRTPKGWSRRVVRKWKSAQFDVDEIREEGRFGRVYAVAAGGSRLDGYADPDGEGTGSKSVTCRPVE